jgi:hypothetical protein
MRDGSVTNTATAANAEKLLLAGGDGYRNSEFAFICAFRPSLVFVTGQRA